MAKIGERLSQPESGWRRYDDAHLNIICTGNWTRERSNNSYDLTRSYIEGSRGKMQFRFKGTKLRIISLLGEECCLVTITIDGIQETFKQYNDFGYVYQGLCYEKIGMENIIHDVIIDFDATIGWGDFDAIDIDSDGKLLHPILTEKTSLEDMEIGDCIKYEYVATSGKCGTFANLGSATKDLIPVTGSYAPNGSAYFIKVNDTTLISDRVVQHNVSWNTLNNGNFIEGKPQAFGVDNLLIRSLSGGIAYLDENGNSSITDKGLGAYPSSNEWTTYIVNSDLNGKITAGDKNVWHTNDYYEHGTWTKNTSLIGLISPETGYKIQNSKFRTIRFIGGKECEYKSGLRFALSNEVKTWGCFRPVLQLKNTKQKTMWY